MKTENIMVVDYNDIRAEFERLTGLKDNRQGGWNAPSERHVVISLTDLHEHSGYHRGEEKFAVFVHLDKPCGADWKDLEYPTDPEEFLRQYGKSGDAGEKYPNTKYAIDVGFFQVLEFLVVSGSLPRGEKILITYEW